jgi:hypothetical protein
MQRYRPLHTRRNGGIVDTWSEAYEITERVDGFGSSCPPHRSDRFGKAFARAGGFVIGVGPEPSRWCGRLLDPLGRSLPLQLHHTDDPGSKTSG